MGSQLPALVEALASHGSLVTVVALTCLKGLLTSMGSQLPALVEGKASHGSLMAVVALT